jgi:hypothetical protein
MGCGSVGDRSKASTNSSAPPPLLLLLKLPPAYDERSLAGVAAAANIGAKTSGEIAEDWSARWMAVVMAGLNLLQGSSSSASAASKGAHGCARLIAASSAFHVLESALAAAATSSCTSCACWWPMLLHTARTHVTAWHCRLPLPLLPPPEHAVSTERDTEGASASAM